MSDRGFNRGIEKRRDAPSVLLEQPPANLNGVGPVGLEGLRGWMHRWSGFPVSETTERWLLARVAALPKKSLRLLAGLLDRAGIDGHEVAIHRASGSRSYLVSTRAFAVDLPSHAVRRLRITTDQLLSLLLIELPRRPEVLPVAALAFGLLPAAPTSSSSLRDWLDAPRALIASLRPMQGCDVQSDPEREAVADLLGAHVLAAQVMLLRPAPG